MWQCPNCGKKFEKKPSKSESYIYNCPSCGLALSSRATEEKHTILRKICEQNEYKLLIDACAGSGIVEDPSGGLKDGSPRILAKHAQESSSPIECVFIEQNAQTYKILGNKVKPYEEVISQKIHENCNEYLLPLISKNTKKTLVFIDPYGFGEPVIDGNVLLKISQEPNTDLLFQFSHGLTRPMGHASENLDCADKTERQKARSYKESLDIYWGDSRWLDLVREGKRYREYAREYAKKFRHGNELYILPIPRRGKSKYHLIFATKQDPPQVGLWKYVY